jgi:hypothetical protein
MVWNIPEIVGMVSGPENPRTVKSVINLQTFSANNIIKDDDVALPVFLFLVSLLSSSSFSGDLQIKKLKIKN